VLRHHDSPGDSSDQEDHADNERHRSERSAASLPITRRSCHVRNPNLGPASEARARASHIESCLGWHLLRRRWSDRRYGRRRDHWRPAMAPGSLDKAARQASFATRLNAA
jgi:hypothetical protein